VNAAPQSAPGQSATSFSEGPRERRQVLPRRTALALIRLYQRRISGGLPPACRFQPTCSHYAYEAIDAHGLLRGAALAAWRLLRCNPLNNGGLDPVPAPSAKPSTPRRPAGA
jgi:putative membrane protein insertion efficiency factor